MAEQAFQETKIQTIRDAEERHHSPSQQGYFDNSFSIWSDTRLEKLVAALAAGRFTEATPVLDMAAKSGVTYPEVDRLLGNSGDESMGLLDLLANENLLEKKPFDKISVDPDKSLLLATVTRCPQCGSGNLTKGQLIEHFFCGNVGFDQDFLNGHQYICPKCTHELKLLGTDYRHAGMQYRCLDCKEIFPRPTLKWRNLISGKTWDFADLQELTLYSYTMSPEKRSWIEFQLKPKEQLLAFLRSHGFHVEEFAEINGSSGSRHIIDILAFRDDVLASFRLGIGILIATKTQGEVGLDELFAFDTKAYDVNLDYKVVVAIPKLTREARNFAERQKIGVFEANEPNDLKQYFGNNHHSTVKPIRINGQSIIETNSALFTYQAEVSLLLKKLGYTVHQKPLIIGRSGAEYSFDIIAQKNDVIICPAIAVAISATTAEELSINKLAMFDAGAFDCGIRNKVFVTTSGASMESRQFAKRQRIKIVEEKELRGLLATIK